MISPLAYVHPDAKLDPSVIVDPFAVIHENVEIGAGTHVMSHAVIFPGARIGKNNKFFPGASIAAVPQDLKFAGEESYVIIGDNNSFREYTTVHRATASKVNTVIGNNNLIMAYCHVAHDVTLGSNIIMSNSVQLAGEVVVDDYAIIGGGSLVHQFTHIGGYCMIQGGSRVAKDIPPYIMAGREPIQYAGVNSVGLRRRGFTMDQINAIQDAYRIIFQGNHNVTKALVEVEEQIPDSPERAYILEFIRESPRGILRGYSA